LLEVLVAVLILAMIAVMAETSIYNAGKTGETVQQHSRDLRQLDRVWVMMENDLRNAVAQNHVDTRGTLLPPLTVSKGDDDYTVTLLRAGHANPLLLPRSEVERVGYRIEDGVLWRDAWVDPYNPDPQTAQRQKLIEDVEEFSVRALPRAPIGKSVDEGPWNEAWPLAQGAGGLPLALEVNLTLKNRDPIRRVLSLSPGL